MKKMSLFMVLAIVLVAGVARADIVAMYQFEGNFNDGSGNGHTGTGMNGATTIGGELVLDGVDDYVSVADSADFHPATTFTITAWIKPNSLGDNNPIVNKYTAVPKTGYYFRVNSDGTLTVCGCKYDQQRSVTSDPALGVVEVGVWTHVAVAFESFGPTWAGSTAWLYINGKEVGTGTMWAPFTANTEPFLIGAYQAGDSSTHRYFDGSMDDVRFYDHTMSAEEVAEALEPVTTPQVDAGPFRSLLWPGSAVTLQMDATVTDNDNPYQLTYTWSQISGPTVTFVEPSNVENPCVTVP